MIRAFAAIPMPEPVTDELERVQGDLRIGRSVLPEHMHMTLVFLGELREPHVEEVHDAFDDIRAPAFELRLRGLGFFGRSAPRSIHAEVEECPPLRHLQAKVEQAARSAGVEVERRRFVPHVTIARLKARREDTAEVADFVARRSLVAPPPFRVEAFSLVRSILGRDAPVYDEHARYPLR
jgi:2'-5' RNA ligase